MGCGTGILAIMAEKRGAEKVKGIDIDDWAYENAKENIELNSCEKIDIQKGTVELLKPSQKFDIILANINKNVLLQDISKYNKHLDVGGALLLSGIYKADKNDIITVAQHNGLTFISELEKKDWLLLKFLKKNQKK